MNIRFISFCLCVLLVLPVFSVQAKGVGDGDKPIEISADSLEIIQPNQTATFRGHVQAVQGDVVLSANAMTVHYRQSKGSEDGAVSRIDAVGKVFLSTPDETARGDKGIYHVDKKIVVLSGDVVLTRDKNVLKGALLEYDFATGRSLITAAGSGVKNEDGVKKSSGRVKALFVPTKKKK